jgi:hypothetical protein
MLDPSKFEKLLLANWTRFINYRELLAAMNLLTNDTKKIEKLSLSRLSRAKQVLLSGLITQARAFKRHLNFRCRPMDNNLST